MLGERVYVVIVRQPGARAVVAPATTGPSERRAAAPAGREPRHRHHMAVGALDCATAAWLPRRCVHGVAHPRGLVAAGWHLSGEGARGPPRRAPGVLVAQPRRAAPHGRWHAVVPARHPGRCCPRARCARRRAGGGPAGRQGKRRPPRPGAPPTPPHKWANRAATGTKGSAGPSTARGATTRGDRPRWSTPPSGGAAWGGRPVWRAASTVSSAAVRSSQGRGVR
jgi:hypothetical protein